MATSSHIVQDFDDVKKHTILLKDGEAPNIHIHIYVAKGSKPLEVCLSGISTANDVIVNVKSADSANQQAFLTPRSIEPTFGMFIGSQNADTIINTPSSPSTISLSGDIKITVGNIGKDLQVEHGNIECGTVSGNVLAKNGRVKCKGNAKKAKAEKGNVQIGGNLEGDATTGRGNITVAGNASGRLFSNLGNVTVRSNHMR